MVSLYEVARVMVLPLLQTGAQTWHRSWQGPEMFAVLSCSVV